MLHYHMTVFASVCIACSPHKAAACFLQGDLLCCEACPAVMHARCAGLAEVPGGDWHCPSCTCAACGHPALQPEADSTHPQARHAHTPARLSGSMNSELCIHRHI